VIRYVVLLRGINVGGKNIVPMARLRDMLGELGYADVATYIASVVDRRGSCPPASTGY
jgi:uncharacterized protein (DUF1697 family)